MLVAVRAIAQWPYAAKQRRNQICQALPDQLHVGVVPIAGHAIGHHRREHALQCGQHGNRERRRNQGKNVLGVKIGNRKGWKAARNPAELAADSRYRKMEERRNGCADQQREYRRGMRFENRGRIRMMASVPRPRPSAEKFSEAKCAASSLMREETRLAPRLSSNRKSL